MLNLFDYRRTQPSAGLTALPKVTNKGYRKMSEKENVQVTPEQVEELKSKIAALETEKANIVGELQDDRKKRQDLQEEVNLLKTSLEDATKKNLESTDPKDVLQTVSALLDQKLGERDASVAKGNKTAAIERFVNENKEFHPENDTTGKRREALENAIAMFNTGGLVSESDFYQVVKNAHRVLGGNTTPSDPAPQNPYSSTSPSSTDPKPSGDPELSAGEKRLIEKNGWTKDRYLALKAKNPGYMEKLVSYQSLG